MNLIEAKGLLKEFIEYEDPKVLPAKHVQAICVLLLELGNKILFDNPDPPTTKEIPIPNITAQDFYVLIKEYEERSKK